MKVKLLALICFAICLAAPVFVQAQGCVAVRNMSSCSLSWDSTSTHDKFLVSLNYRYFRSYKHFRGDHEEKERVENGTEVINNDNSVIFGFSWFVNNKFSLGLSVPVLYIDRSSLYEHYGNQLSANPDQLRFHTSAKGLGDVRVMGNYNLSIGHATRLTLGLGIKLPTGNYAYKDHFHKKSKDGSDSLVYRVVDQSIQPGDGGVGIITEANFVRALTHRMSAYADGFYMLNPRNTNGVIRSSLTTNVPHGNEFSVADQFFARLGMRYAVRHWQFGAGARIEGIPARDLVGRNDGFRRPGHIVSAEPSIVYSKGPHIFNINVPVALYRNRIRSVFDVQRSAETNTRQHGDAAFADWLLSVSYAYKIR
jgi:hypothetical protein